MRLPEFRALIVPPQSSETQLIPFVPLAKLSRVCERESMIRVISRTSFKLTDEDDHLVIGRVLNHLVHDANILILISHIIRLSVQHAMKVLPAIAPVT